MKRAIVILGEKNGGVLRKTCEPVKHFGKEKIRQLVEDLFDTLDATEDGAGLAAPQIGVAKRIFITNIRDEDDVVQRRAFINPKVVRFVGEEVDMNEGCLSLPGVRDSLWRPESVIVKFIDENGREQEIKATGWFARCVQHELDHLDGTLIIDHTGMSDQRAIDAIRAFREAGAEPRRT